MEAVLPRRAGGHGACHELMAAAPDREIFADRVEEHPEWVEPSLVEHVRDGREYSGLEYQRVLVRRLERFDQMRRLFDDDDLLLSHTMPDTARPAEAEPDTPLFVRGAVHLSVNLTGHPAVSVPCGFDQHVRPIGLQIVAG